MSTKRAATQELNHDNWDDREEPEKAGTFKKASESELQQRARKVAKLADSPQHNVDAASNPSKSQPDYQENYYSNQGYTANQQGQYNHDPYSQQNYSCYTPTINATISYMTSNVSQAAQTTQSKNYSQIHEVASNINDSTSHHESEVDSLHRQPHSIPTYSAAVNATAKKSSKVHITQSQQQIVSSIKSLESVQTMPTVGQVDELVDLSIKKVFTPAPASMEPNDELAESNSLPSTTDAPLKSEKSKTLEDPLEDISV